MKMKKLIWNFPWWFHSIVLFITGSRLVKQWNDDNPSMIAYFWITSKNWKHLTESHFVTTKQK